MAGNGTLRDPMEGLRDLCSAEIWGMEMSKVNEPPRRFEAGFFASEGYRAVDAMHHSGFSMETVGETSSVVWPGVFARRFVKDPGHGAPFMTTSVMMEARPRPSNYLSYKNTKNLDAYLVREGTILISRSGTVGNVCLATKDIEGWAVSDDAIRVTVHEPDHLGPVYCFLQSPLGQFLLKKSQTGSVVRHIYEADVSTLPIPHLPRALREELTRLVKQASSLRVEANRLLDEAEAMVQKQLYLPDIEEFYKARPSADDTGATVFTASARQRVFGQVRTGRRRLDATAYDPAGTALREHLLAAENGTTLRSLLAGVRNSNLRKRVYVEERSNGVPLMGGKQLMQLRPSDLSLLSKALTKNLKREQVDEGWVVVSCGGTVGRTLLVHRNYNGWVMSQHVMRVIANPGKVAPGFVYAFLASPYGQLQLQQMSYGSVQKELRDFHFQDIAIRIPEDQGKAVHDVAIAGFDARADAMEVEDQAFSLFMTAVKRGRKTIESEWGDQY